MLIVLAVLAVVVLLGLALVLLDRNCATLAERKAAEFLSAPFGRPAVVRIEGSPFLLQALRGCYREVHVSGGGLTVGEMSGATLDARLDNAYLSTRRLLRRRRRNDLTCEHVSGRLVLPYGELARVARIPGLQLRPVGDQLLASAALPIPGFSQLARVSGEAVWTVGGGGSVWLRVQGVSVAGIALPDVVLSQLLPALSVPIPLPELPYGLRIDHLQPSASGLVISGSAAAVVFRGAPHLAVPTPG